MKAKAGQVQGVWRVEADAPLQAVYDAAECPPLFRRTLGGALSWQVRNETSVRRALASPRVAPRWLAALLALGATAMVEDSSGVSTEVHLQVLLRREAAGKVVALHVRTAGLRWGEASVSRTPADEPIVSAVAAVELRGSTVEKARVALTGVWPEPVRLAEAPARLVGGPLETASIQAAAAALQLEVAPGGDFLGSEPYRRAMAGVVARRALEQCMQEKDA